MNFIKRNILTLSILLLGICSTVFARGCINFKPVEDFSIKKFAGNWYVGGAQIGNSTDDALFGDMQCVTVNFAVVRRTTSNVWNASAVIKGQQRALNGTYSLPDPEEGVFNFYFSQINATYDFLILCTDYESYAIFYACVERTAADKSEYVGILVRDQKKYDEIVAKLRKRRCLRKVLSKNITESIKKVPFNNCPSL